METLTVTVTHPTWLGKLLSTLNGSFQVAAVFVCRTLVFATALLFSFAAASLFARLFTNVTVMGTAIQNDHTTVVDLVTAHRQNGP